MSIYFERLTSQADQFKTWKTFNEYLNSLNESFDFSEIDFGNNLKRNNQRFDNYKFENGSAANCTFFIYDSLYFMWAIEHTLNRFNFSCSIIGITIEESGDEDTFDPSQYTDTPTKYIATTSFLHVLNYTIYIFKKYIENNDSPNYIAFHGSDSRKNKLYRHMMKNTSFQKVLKELNYTFLEDKENHLIFKKI